jgi:SAM-dependent MidA family methyltransferase
LPDGFTVEISPAAAAWWSRAAGALRHGKLLTIDYGLTDEEVWKPERAHGTVRAYHRHHISGSVLDRPGEQDITAHVNFTQLQRAGEAAGLQTDGLFTQEQFFTHIVEKIWREPARFGDWSPARLRQFQTLTHPAQMGRAFRVLIQSAAGDQQ